MSDVKGDTSQTEHGAHVLDDVVTFLRAFMAFPFSEQADAVALWIIHTHAIEAFETTPRLAILSPEKASGKTRLLELLDCLACNPISSVNMTPAVVFRLIAEPGQRKTLLVDEIDNVFSRTKGANNSGELLSLLNAGYRSGAVVHRCVGEGANIKVQTFPAFAAVALAGLDELPDTLASRSIHIRLKRRAPGERLEEFRPGRIRPRAQALSQDIALWVATQMTTLLTADPLMPSSVTDRNADIWAPLFAIADCAAGDWPERARNAAVSLIASEAGDNGSRGVRLLADIRGVFEQTPIGNLSSSDLCEALAAIEESPWGNLYGSPIDPRGLARMVGGYGIRPHSVRIGDKTPKGYAMDDFEDTWSRYLPASRNTATKLGGKAFPEDMEAGSDLNQPNDGVADVADVAPMEKAEARQEILI